MKSVKINRKELLTKVKANRDAHSADYAEAMIGYRKAVIERLTALLSKAESGAEIDTDIDLTKPITRVGDYDRAIFMLEMSVDEIIELDTHEFDKYVMDNWDWKHLAITANSLYKTL